MLIVKILRLLGIGRLFILLAVIVEQVIKIIINKYFMNTRLEIIEDMISFYPYFNDKYSWFNSVFKLGISLMLHIVVALICIMLIFLLYRYIISLGRRSLFIEASYIFVFSGALCSLIDRVFWGGSLDYIELKGFFIFDLKDMYMTIGEVILAVILIGGSGLKFNLRSDIKDIKGFFSFSKSYFVKGITRARNIFSADEKHNL